MKTNEPEGGEEAERRSSRAPALKARIRNRSRSISGSASRAWRRANSAPRTTPATSATHGRPVEAVLREPLEREDHRQHRGERERGAERGRAGRRPGRATRAAAAGRARAAAPSPARRSGTPSPTRRTRAARRRRAGRPPRRRRSWRSTRRSRPCARRGSANMLKISASVDGASVAPATPSSARAAISIGALVEKAASTEAAPNAAAPIISSRRRPIRSPSVPIVISSAGDEEAVDVDDPEQLAAARLQVLADRGEREVQHGQVHRVEQAGERDDGESDPLASAGVLGSLGGVMSCKTGAGARTHRAASRSPARPAPRPGCAARASVQRRERDDVPGAEPRARSRRGRRARASPRSTSTIASSHAAGVERERGAAARASAGAARSPPGAARRTAASERGAGSPSGANIVRVEGDDLRDPRRPRSAARRAAIGSKRAGLRRART